MQARKPAVSPHLQPQRFPLSFIVDQMEILNSTSDYLKSFNKDIESDIRFSSSQAGKNGYRFLQNLTKMF